MNLNYKFRLYPSKAQEMEMLETLDSCRWLYNHFLGEWGKTEKVPPKYDLQSQIPRLVKKNHFLENIHSKTRQYVLWQLYSNLKALGRSKKKGRKVGRLRFKKYGRFKTFVYNQTGFKLNDNKLHLSKIGDIKIKLHREIKGNIKQIYVKRRQSGRWFAIFSVETESKQYPMTSKAVGIDLNLKNYLTDSDGMVVEHPHHLKRLEKKLKREHKRLSKKKKGSINRQKQRIRLARTYERLADTRSDFTHKLSHYYVSNYDFIAVEDLNVGGMIQHPYLAKSISDSCWSQFTTQMSYKAEGARKTFVAIDRFYPSTKRCSCCGNIREILLSERTYICPICGMTKPRDQNSAENILDKALLEVPQELGKLTPVEMRPLRQNFGFGASFVKEAGSSFQKP